MLTPAIPIQNKKACNHKASLSESVRFLSRNSFCEDFFKVLTPAIPIQNKKACNHKASLSESVRALMLHFLLTLSLILKLAECYPSIYLQVKTT